MKPQSRTYKKFSRTNTPVPSKYTTFVPVPLPDHPGYELFGEIKERGLDEKPVLVVSSVQEEVVNPPENVRVKYDKYQEKPVPVGKITEEIHEVLSREDLVSSFLCQSR